MRTALILLLSALTLSCTEQNDGVVSMDRGAAIEPAPEIGIPPPPEMDDLPPPPGSSGRIVTIQETSQLDDAARMLTHRGNVRLEVEELQEAMRAADEIVQGVEGYFAGTDMSEGQEGSRTARLALRVPAESFDRTLDELGQLGRVINVSRHANDVTRQYIDLETRLAVQEEMVERLRALLGRSGELSDLLAVERELGRATADLESMKGEIRYLERSVDLSDVQVMLVEPGAVVRAGIFRPVTEAFREAFGVLAGSVAQLIYALAFLLPWLVVAALLWRPIRGRWRAARKSASAR